MSKPVVLFVCVHNAGRSQMAAGWLRQLAGDTVEVRSAGSAPRDQINPIAVEAMREVGIDITGAVPQLLESDTARASDVIITMGCGDACPVFPGKRYEDWELDRPRRPAHRGRPPGPRRDPHPHRETHRRTPGRLTRREGMRPAIIAAGQRLTGSQPPGSGPFGPRR